MQFKLLLLALSALSLVSAGHYELHSQTLAVGECARTERRTCPDYAEIKYTIITKKMKCEESPDGTKILCNHGDKKGTAQWSYKA